MSLADSALAMLAPPRCLCCGGRLLPSSGRGVLCAACETEMALAPPVRIRGDGVDSGLAALPYRGAGRRLVAALKFGRLLPAAELGARLIVARAPAALMTGAVVPVPPAPLRTASRGIDATLALASSLAEASGLEVLPILRRRDVRRQRGRSRAQRLERPPAIVAAARATERVLLLDDVVTTGATVDACARALRRAGAARLGVVAIAAVPPSRRRLPPKPGRA